MRRLQLVSFMGLAPATRRTDPPTQPAAPTVASPRDEMWRSRRVASGSNWTDAWVRKPTERGP